MKSRAVCAAVAAGLMLAIVGPGELMASAPVAMRLSYEITASGTGELIANLVPNGTGRYGWRRCSPAGECVRVAGSDGGRVIGAGHSPSGTTFIATVTIGGSSASVRSLPYRGVVRATEAPRAAGALRVGALVRPLAARWVGGWGNESDRLQVQVCRTEDGGCIVLYDSVNDQRTGRSGATIPQRFRNWLLRVADQRIGRDALFGPRRAPALPLAPHATVSTATLGRIPRRAPPHRPAVPQGSANMRAARADARSLLALLRLPSGARRSAVEPAGDAGTLAHPMGLYASPPAVDEHAFWTVAASPASVLAFVRSFPPDGLKPFTTGFGSGPGMPNTYDEGFEWPPITNVVESRWLFVEAEVLADGMTGVIADAGALAITPRGTVERIPAGTARLSVTTYPDGGGKILLASVTSQPKIREVVTLLNGLPLLPVAVGFGCPPISPQQVQLAFYSRRDARLAVASFDAWPVTANVGSCDFVSLTINGRLEQPPLLALWYPRSGLSRFPPLLTRLDATLDIKIPDSVRSL